MSSSKEDNDDETYHQPPEIALLAAEYRIEQLKARDKESRQTIDTLTKDVQSLKASLGQLQRAKGKLDIWRESAIQRARILESELEQAKETATRLQSELDETNLQADEERESLSAQLKSTEEDLAGERLWLIFTRQTASQLADLLAERSRELVDALALVPKGNAISYSDVIDMVDGLNGEMSQISAMVKNARSKGGEVSRDEREAAEAIVGAHLGPTTTELLKAVRAQAHDRLLVQLVIEAYLIQKARNLVGSECIPVPTSPAVTCFMTRIQEEVLELGGIPRALKTTFAHT